MSTGLITGCQVGNVAMNKRAISNDHSAALGEWVDENAMTDGVTRTSTRTCPVIWTMTSTPAAWLIDLETTHKVSRAYPRFIFCFPSEASKCLKGNILG